MRELPRKAQIYLLLIYLAGSSITAWAVIRPIGQAHTQFWELGLFLMLAALAGSRKIRLMRHKSLEDVGSMSLGFAITFAAMLRFGPAGGLMVSAVSALSGAIYPTCQPPPQLLFNVALSAIEAWVAGLVFLTLNQSTLHLDLNQPRTFSAVAASALTFYVVNTGGVATIIALCKEQPPFQVWRETFLWTAPSYFAGACVSTLAMLLCGNNVGAILLFGSPVAYLTYHSYATYTARAEEKQQHIEELQVSQEHLAGLYLATIKSLALAIDAKDQYTHQHILRVQRYAMATARHMGISGAELEGVNTGALLHDIGKLGVPEYVLLKPGRLTDEEFAKIKKHPEIGAAILDPVEFPWPVLPVVKYHHEKWDGTGYPEGLKGEDIPLTARILAVGDVYDALTSTRSYRSAWSHEKAIALIKKDSGTHFDPVVAQAFLEIIDGVIEAMKQEGHGPLVAQTQAQPISGSSKADQAARDIQRASSELWALYEVAQTLSTSLGLQETLDILARKLETILSGTACLFLLKEEGVEALVVRAAVGVNREFFEGGRTLGPTSRSVAVVRDRFTYLSGYDPDDLMLKSVETLPWVPLESALIVPIVHQGEVLGTINIYHPNPNAFGPHDRQLLETIAERSAMAIFNGLLFDRTRSHAFTDPLTGLYNVRYLTEYVEERCRGTVAGQENRSGSDNSESRPDVEPPQALRHRRESDLFTLLCLDLDSFKPINDNFGHQKGDQVLRDLSRIFRSTVKEGDIVARYGGDEFVIVLDGASAREGEAMCRRLEAAVIGYDPGLNHPRLGALRLGVSVGFACFPPDGQDCASLMAAADSQMYYHKTERKLGKLAQMPARPEETEPGETLPIAA